jgi:Ca2+-binding EF-hand superfamily protein
VVTFLVDKIAAALIPVDASTLRLLRLARLMRLVRLLRAMESLDVLYVMATAIRGMRHVVVWGMALLVVMLMMCALIINIVLQGGYFADIGDLSGEDLATKVKMYQYFGTFTRCLFSMFELTLANWPPVARLLTEEITEWFMLFCIMHKLTIGFAVVGVINGVILQETFKVAGSDDMIMVRQKRRDQASLRAKLSALFEALDYSEDGALDYEEFELISSHPEIRLWLAAMDIETDDLKLLFTLIDTDGSGTVTPMELMTRIPRLKGTARAIDLLALNAKMLGADYNAKTDNMLIHP